MEGKVILNDYRWTKLQGNSIVSKIMLLILSISHEWCMINGKESLTILSLINKI